MKLACASGAFHRAIERGDLTQLEFVDLCAREFACDGVVLDVRHFPRNDDDYLAQIKKMAADRGLSVAALADPAFFAPSRQGRSGVLETARVLGAPIVAAPLSPQTGCSWSEQLAVLHEATASAKAENVTLALRNAPQTFAASSYDCKRTAKETDSAWLRFGPEPGCLGAGDDPALLAPNTVLLWAGAGSNAEAIGETLAAFAGFLGHLALDDAAGEADAGAVRAAVRAWRLALSRRELDSTAQ